MAKKDIKIYVQVLFAKDYKGKYHAKYYSLKDELCRYLDNDNFVQTVQLPSKALMFDSYNEILKRCDKLMDKSKALKFVTVNQAIKQFEKIKEYVKDDEEYGELPLKVLYWNNDIEDYDYTPMECIDFLRKEVSIEIKENYQQVVDYD